MDTNPPAPSDARALANAAQRAASDPAVSAFVSASAGSGKTKLLTDRLLRLMLGGADPARIQCLTYTRAAAAEMALRLQSELGRWATLDDAALDARLRALDVTPDEALRQRARALFAQVLDLPGGMRIGTIHAFCQSLLRRFPLEARVSPHFRLIEDAQADAARRSAEEAVLGGAAASAGEIARRRAALDRIAWAETLARFDGLLKLLIGERERLTPLLARPEADIAAAQRAVLCATQDEAAVLRGAVAWPDGPALAAALREIAAKGPPGKTAPAARARLDWLSGDAAARQAGWTTYAVSYVTGKGEPCSWKTLVGEVLGKARPDLVAAMTAEQQRVAAIGDAVAAARCAAMSEALLTLALPVARAYAAGKQAVTKLDYADLIDRTLALLATPEDAAWVLFKLDGGLDHLLLDEVQDTAPAQWRIAGALAAEFFAGEGAREAPRTVFAVGDSKQSIFSFQGADPDAFETWRQRLGRQVRDAGLAWRDEGMNVSFRSTTPVLRLTDAVFADPEAAHGVGGTAHVSDRAGQAGQVELWPLAPPPDAEEPPVWDAPRERRTTTSAPQRLAETLAAWIAEETAGGVMLQSRGRPLGPGDVLILLRTRAMAPALVRCLKQRGVRVAGLDRMVLTEQPAVADLLALCDTLLLPQDDLSLACVLTSPLGGLSDDSLMDLAAGRSEKRLWETLHRRAGERADWAQACGFLDGLFARADFVTPHALLADALGAGGGRARLLARLGAEAAEPIDELLAAALTHAGTEPPSLQGFLHWLRQSAAEIKREPHAAAGPGEGMVRIMTVHGAKGLQAPLVILPDTTGMPQDDGPLLWAAAEGYEVPVWSPHRDLRCEATRALRDAAAARRTAEHNRLLYVALTRAEDRLVICGFQPRKAVPPGCWYDFACRGFARLGARPAPWPLPWGAWPGERLVADSPQQDPPDRPDPSCAGPAPVALPPWAGLAPAWRPLPPPAEPQTPLRLAPSRPDGAQFGAVPQAASPLVRQAGEAARFRRGHLLHAMLQHLPNLPPPARAAAAESFLRQPGSGLTPAEARAALADVLGVLDHPALAPLFAAGSRAEVPLTGAVGGAVIGGLVDRLAVLPDRVLVADYKTARAPPAGAEDAPALYLRQMAAYRAVLRLAFPGRDVRCVLVWTTGAVVVPLPPALLDRHAPGPGAPAAHQRVVASPR